MRRLPLSRRVAIAATTYAIIIFVIGFAVGTLRTLFVVPRVGAVPAVAIELPLILSAAWLVCGWVLARFHVPSDTATRAAMALTAFSLLMALEFGFATLVFGTPARTYLSALITTAGLLGLIGQLAFAAFPVVRRA